MLEEFALAVWMKTESGDNYLFSYTVNDTWFSTTSVIASIEEDMGVELAFVSDFKIECNMTGNDQLVGKYKGRVMSAIAKLITLYMEQEVT